MRKKINLPEVEGVELPCGRTFLTVKDLREGEEAFLGGNQLYYDQGRKGVLLEGSEVLFLLSSVPLTWLTRPAYPLLLIQRRKLLFDVTVFFTSDTLKFQKIARGAMEDGGRKCFYLSSYKEEKVDSSTTWTQILGKISAKGDNKAVTPAQSGASEKKLLSF